MSNTPELTILMPCLNEAETLETCINKALQWLDSADVLGEIVVADNGSVDGSQSKARALGARVIDVKVRGYGAALIEGSRSARGTFIIMGDSDDSYDFSKLDSFLRELRAGSDLVMGNRFLGGIDVGAMPWKNRHIGNPALSLIGRLLFRIPIGDFHCGLRGYSKKAFDKMALRTTGMEFASEMVIKAKLLNLKISEVPTTLSKDGRSRPPHLNPWRDGWRHLRFMISLQPTKIFIIPGILQVILGLVLYVPILMFGSLKLGNVGLSTNSLIFTSAIFLCGYAQLILGSVLSVFAVREGVLPQKSTQKFLEKIPAFEVGLIVGVGSLLLGIVGFVYSVWNWSTLNFGPLQNQSLTPTISISGTLIVFGGMTIGSSFVSAFFKIPFKKVEG